MEEATGRSVLCLYSCHFVKLQLISNLLHGLQRNRNAATLCAVKK